MGGSRQTCSASLPPDRYWCVLDELPLHLLPQPARGLLRDTPSANLLLNPECRLRSAQDPPDELSAREDLLSGFALLGTIAWIRDAGTGMLLPFWLSANLETLVRQLLLKEILPSSIPAASQALLQAAGILISAESLELDSRLQYMRAAALQFQTKSYAPVANLIHPFHVAALRRYYRHQIRTGAIALGDRQSARRYVAHNEPVAKFFHHQLTSAFSRVAGTTLKPSYVYCASYLEGAELKKHTDRDQCDFSITFCLDYSPEPELATPWPINLQTKKGTVTVYQALGDGLAYRGMELPHYRGKLWEGQTSTSIFFHYVTEEFAGSLD